MDVNLLPIDRLRNDDGLICRLVLENVPHAFVDILSEQSEMATDDVDAEMLRVGLECSVLEAFDLGSTPLEAFLRYHAEGNLATSTELKAFEDLYVFVGDDLYDVMVETLVREGYAGPSVLPCVVKVKRTAIYDKVRTRVMVPVAQLASTGQAVFATIKDGNLQRDENNRLLADVDSWLAIDDFVTEYTDSETINEIVATATGV